MVLIVCFEHTTILYERIILPIKLNQHIGTPGATRTPNLRFRRPMLCPVELRGYVISGKARSYVVPVRRSNVIPEKMPGGLTTRHSILR